MSEDMVTDAIETIRGYAEAAEAGVCGEYHLNAWPDCKHHAHDRYFEVLEALKFLASVGVDTA